MLAQVGGRAGQRSSVERELENEHLARRALSIWRSRRVVVEVVRLTHVSNDAALNLLEQVNGPPVTLSIGDRSIAAN